MSRSQEGPSNARMSSAKMLILARSNGQSENSDPAACARVQARPWEGALIHVEQQIGLRAIAGLALVALSVAVRALLAG